MEVKRYKLLLLAVLIFAVVFGLTGCFKKKPIGMSTTAPDWIFKGSGAFDDAGDKVFYGVGAVTGIHNKPLAVTTADNRARAEITKIFETYSASLMKDYAASTTGGGAVTEVSATTEEQHIEQAIKTFSAATLSGIMIIDHWENPSDGTYYSLARLDIKKFKNSLEEIKELNAAVRDYVRKNAERAFDDLAEEESKRGN